LKVFQTGPRSRSLPIRRTFPSANSTKILHRDIQMARATLPPSRHKAPGELKLLPPQVRFMAITIDGRLLRRGTIGVENTLFSEVHRKLPQKDRDFS
jgi:hypothetical protein